MERHANLLKGNVDEQDAMTQGCKTLIEKMLYDDHSSSCRHSPQKFNSRYSAMGVIENRRRRGFAVSGADVRMNRDVVGTNVLLIRLLRPKVLSVLD